MFLLLPDSVSLIKARAEEEGMKGRVKEGWKGG
jgi:hypothetical protein